MYSKNQLRINKKGQFDWKVIAVMIVVAILLYLLLRNA